MSGEVCGALQGGRGGGGAEEGEAAGALGPESRLIAQCFLSSHSVPGSVVAKKKKKKADEDLPSERTIHRK